MTHPGARPGRAGGGWAEAWSGQRERGRGSRAHCAARWGLCLLIRLAAPAADWSPAGPAPWQWARTSGCKSVREGPLPQVGSHLSSNFRAKVRPGPSSPLLPGPARRTPCWTQRRLWPPLPGPLSQPGLRGRPGPGLPAASLVHTPSCQAHRCPSPSPCPRFLSARPFVKRPFIDSCPEQRGWGPRGPGSRGTDQTPSTALGARLCPQPML